MQLIGSPPPARTVIRLVGSGGMGVVYEALDERLDRRVALKALHPHLTNTPETRDRLLREARLAARVEHAGVVRIYTIHEHDGGLCLEMQYVEGVPLSQLLKGHPLTPSYATDLMRQVLEALVACHAKNVIHGDLKPANLMVTPEGRVMLADFGIARAIYPDGGGGITFSVTSGAVWGTPQYCPPEALEGAAPNARWDLYALGILVYEALTGKVPFAGQTLGLLIREKLEGAQRPIAEIRSDLSPELSALVDALAARNPEDRPQSAAEALEALHRVPQLGADLLATMPLRHSEVMLNPASSSRLDFVTASSSASHRKGSRFSPAGLLVVTAVLALATFGAYYAGMSSGASVGPPVLPPSAAVGKPGDVLDLVAVEGRVVFSYDDGKNGRELWVGDTEGKVTLVADIYAGPGSSNPHQFIVDDQGRVLFAATSKSQGEEPWVFSNPSSVRILADLVPGPMHSEPRPVAAHGPAFVFYATTIGAGERLWVSDTHHKRTGPLEDLNPDAAALPGRPQQVRVDADGIVYHKKRDGRFYLLRYLFADNRIQDLGTISTGTDFVSPRFDDLDFIGDACIFSCYRPETGQELWRLDPGGEQAQLLKDIWEGTESGDPIDFYQWNGALYFRATTLGHGTEFWTSDGTPQGTLEFADLYAGEGSGSPSNFIGAGGRLFFRAEHRSFGMELWVTDGNPRTPPRVFDLNPGQASSNPYSLKTFGGYLFFSANGGANGEEFWALDLSAPDGEPFLVEDIKPGPESSEPHTLTPLTENSGVFVYKTDRGEGLMMVEVMGREIKLRPSDPLPLK